MTNRTVRLTALGGVAVALVMAPLATPATAAECQFENRWCSVPQKKGVAASAAVVKNDHNVNKAVGRISIKHSGQRTRDKTYVKWRPSGSRFGVGPLAWTYGPRVSPGGRASYWWDYYYSGLEPYAFEFRICLADRGPDTCGTRLKIKDPKTPRF